jgi:hypothetical protein
MLHALKYLNLYLQTNNKIFQWFKWVANILIFAGAISVAISPVYSQQPWPFILATIGSCLWLWAASIMRDRAFIAFNLFFVVIQSTAIFMRLH